MKLNNIERAELYKVTPELLGVLIMINSNTSKSKYLHDLIEIYLEDYKEGLEKLDWLEYTKTGKTEAQKVRLNTKGKTFLKSLEFAPISNTASNIWDILEQYYKKYDLTDKILNKTKTTFYINEFITEKESEGKPYNEKMMEAVIKTYLSAFEDNELKFAKKTLNLFYDNKNAFAKKWSKEDCPIYDYINRNGKEIAKVYAKL